jgi:hypothetical protein
VTHVQICRPSTGKISKRTLSPKTRFFAPLAFCTEGPNHYMAMVLAILWVCVSNMHSHVMVWALGAKSDFGGSVGNPDVRLYVVGAMLYRAPLWVITIQTTGKPASKTALHTPKNHSKVVGRHHNCKHCKVTTGKAIPLHKGIPFHQYYMGKETLYVKLVLYIK